MRTVRARLAKFLSSRRLLVAAMLAGLLLRLVWAFAAGDQHRMYDSDSYVKIADNLLQGKGFLWGDQRIGRPPLYPLLVAATRTRLFGREFLLLYVVQSLLSALSILLFAAGARRLVGKTAGGITAFVVALDPFLVFYSGAALSETLFIFFLSLLFYAVVMVLSRPAPARAFLGGLAAGGAFLTRPSVPGLFALMALSAIIWARPRWKGLCCALLMLITALAVVSPWAARNHRLTGRWIFTTLGVGASLYDGVGPQADGSSNMNFLHSMPELALMDEVARDQYLLGRAVKALVESPVRVLKLAGAKAVRFWSPVPNSADFKTLTLVLVSFLAVVPVYALAIAAVFSGVLRRRDFFVLASGPIYFTLVHMVFVGSTRYRCPIMPFVAVIASAFAAAFLLKGKKGLGGPGARHRGAAARLPAAPAKMASHKRRGLLLFVRVFLLMAASAGLACAGGYAYYTRWVANPDNVRALALEKIGLLFPGKTVTVSSAEFALLEGLKLHGVAVSEPSGATIGRLDEVAIEFDLDIRGLTDFELLPETVNMAGLYLDLVRSAQGSWNLTAPGMPMAAVSASQKPARRLASPFSISLRDAFVSVDDQTQQYSVSFTVDNAFFAAYGEDLSRWRSSAAFGGPLLGNWHVSAQGDFSEESLTLVFGGVDLDLGEGLGNRMPRGARGAFQYFRPVGRAAVSGEASFAPKAGWDFAVKASLSGCSATCSAFPLAISNLTGQLAFSPQGCRFDRLEGEIPSGRVAISGFTQGYSRDAGLRVRVAAAKVLGDDTLIAALPPSVRNGIEDFHPRGLFDASVQANRAQGPGQPVELTVNLYLRDISALFKHFPYPVDDISGRVGYEDGVVAVDELSGRRGAARFAFTGSVTTRGEDRRADITVTAKALALDETLKAAVPERVRDIWTSLAAAGTADVKARAVFSRAAATVDFDARLSDVALCWEKLPYALYAGKGGLSYTGGVVRVGSFRLARGDASILLDGLFDTKDNSFAFDVETQDLRIDDELTQALPQAARDELRRAGLRGRADARARIASSPDGPPDVSELSGTLRGAAFRLTQLPLGIGAAEVSFSRSKSALDVGALEGFLFPDSALAAFPAVRFAGLARPPAAITASGTLPLGGAQDGLRARFDASRVFIDDSLLAGLPETTRSALGARGMCALVDVAGQVSRVPGKSAGTQYEFSIACEEGVLRLGWPLEEIQGRFSLEGHSAEGTDAFSVTGLLDSFLFAGRPAGQTEFALTKEAGEARIDRLKTRTLGGMLTGTGRIDITRPGAFGIDARVTNVSLSELVRKAFSFSREGMTGTLDGQLRLLSRGAGTDVIGSAEVNVTDGTLWEVPMVLALLNVLNLKLPQRTQFRSAYVRLQISGDRIVVDEMSLASDPATLVGRGTMTTEGDLDLTFYARPGRIPILSLIAGEVTKNFFMARVTGTFSSPDISIVPSGAFGSLLRRPRAASSGSR